MISGSGIYVVSVNESNNPTYLREGLYRVFIDQPYANFRNVRTGSGTFEKLNMLRIFEKQGRVVCTPVSPNREQLEADLLAFDAWRAA